MPPQENLLVHLGSTTFVLTITDGVVYFMFRPPYLLKLLQENVGEHVKDHLLHVNLVPFSHSNFPQETLGSAPDSCDAIIGFVYFILHPPANLYFYLICITQQ